ncbi:MAG TPA: hypothetical protein VJ892_01200 [Candidatus Absconditabacterales bacterium]|nr:hypothetical protein [Candidatus Absconditabacterales bacterium]
MKKYLVLLEKNGQIKHFILNSEDKDFVKNLKPSIVVNIDQAIAIDLVDEKVIFCRSNEKRKSFVHNPIYGEGLILVGAQYGMNNVDLEILDYTNEFD